MGILGLHNREDIGEKKFEASHAGGFHATKDVELIAAADVEEEKLVTFGDAWDIPIENRYADHREMLESEPLDIVSVCTPTLFHHDHVIDAAHSSAKPSVIWCEKPIASSIKQAKEMQSACAETNTELVINHSFRFVEKVRQLRSLIQNGLIGDVKSVTAQFRRELMRNSTHILDTLLFLMDTRASRVAGYINGENDAVDSLEGERSVVDAGGSGMMLMDDGSMAMVDCTVARDISSMNLQIIGTEGKLSLGFDDQEWRYWDLNDGDHVEKTIPEIDEGWSWDQDYTSAFSNAAQDIVDLAEGKKPNPSTGEDATRSLEIIVGYYISHYTSSIVTLPLEPPLEETRISSW